MSAILNVLPAVACAALMGIPAAIGMTRRRLRRRRRTSGSPGAPAPGVMAATPRR
jgi:hypothetical protein